MPANFWDSVRRRAPRGPNGLTIPWAVLTLALLHGAAYWYESQSCWARATLSLQPGALLRRGDVWRAATGDFVTSGRERSTLAPIFFALFVFGLDAERRLGGGRTLALYLCAGVFASAAWSMSALVWDWRRPLTIGVSAAALVASGTWRGWRRPILVGNLPIPAWIPAGVYLLAVWWWNAGGAAELSALVFSALFGIAARQLPTPTTDRRRAAKPHDSDGPRTPTPPAHVLFDEEAISVAELGADFDAEVDALLLKIAERGYESLNENEIALLLKASKRYRQRGDRTADPETT